VKFKKYPTLSQNLLPCKNRFRLLAKMSGSMPERAATVFVHCVAGDEEVA